MARQLGVAEGNIRTSNSLAGRLVFPGEPVIISRRKSWIRVSSIALQQKRHIVSEKASDCDSAVLPVISPPAIVESPEQDDIAIPPLSMCAYAAISDFGPDRTDRAGVRPDGWLQIKGKDDSTTQVCQYTGLMGERALCDRVMHRLEQALRTESVCGVSIDLRMVGAGEALDYLRFLRRVRKAAGRGRRVIASVPGEWFCREWLHRGIFRAAIAGFALEDMLELVDVAVVRCWRDPAFSDVGDSSYTSLDFVREVISTAAKKAPCWKLAAGFMCGAVVGHSADEAREDYLDAYCLSELAQRFVVRRRYFPEDDSLKAHFVSRRISCDFWFEDSRTLAKRLALVNRYNLLGVELFWPGAHDSLIEACRDQFEPLQEFEGRWRNSSTEPESKP